MMMDRFPENEEEKKDSQNEVPVLEPWQCPPDPKHAYDLDFTEIAELNRLEDEGEPRGGSFWPFIVVVVLILLFFQTFIFHDALESFIYAQKIQRLDIPTEYSGNQMMVSSREAVVLIRGEDDRGSGFNIDPSGLIVTNRHVVKDESVVRVYFPDGSYYTTTSWWESPSSDLAVLKIDGSGLPYLKLSAKELGTGQKVYFIGSPESSWWMMTEGTVGQYYENQEGNILSIGLKQGIGPGASGSPVLNAEGEAGAVIFAVSAGESREAYAIPISVLQQFLSSGGND